MWSGACSAWCAPLVLLRRRPKYVTADTPGLLHALLHDLGEGRWGQNDGHKWQALRSEIELDGVSDPHTFEFWHDSVPKLVGVRRKVRRFLNPSLGERRWNLDRMSATVEPRSRLSKNLQFVGNWFAASHEFHF